MKRRIAIALVLMSATVVAADGDAWVRVGSPNQRSRAEVLSPDRYREIEPARISNALSDLAVHPFVALTEAQMLSHVGASLRCAPALHPFLVRAVVGHRSTGGFYVQQFKSTLFITHSSLGRSEPTPAKSALVVCTSDVSDVFPSFGVAE